uniref:Probable purine permease n=1 Tax=Leersia perrieri TaxID=77586 RepID=A0A0D9WYH3_9ORYZ
MAMLLVGEAMAPLLSRMYYNSGGKSLWMVTLAQSAGSPLLIIPLLLTPRATAGEPRPVVSKIAAICVGLGLIIGCNDLMFSYAMLYLSVSTFSLAMALFASGEWRTIHGEMAEFKNGKVAYMLTLMGIAVALFGDKMMGTKVVTMLMAVWGFLSYVYQHYLDGQYVVAMRNGRGSSHDEGREVQESATCGLKRCANRRWMLVLADMLMLLVGEAMAPLLSRFYYNSGGNSLWMTTLVQSAGSPLLVIPLLLTPQAAVGEPRPTVFKMSAICVGLGLIIGCDNLMYSYAMLYLPVSTFSLMSSTQLAFNAVTSRLINSQRFTSLIVNSIVVLTFSAALLGVDNRDGSTSSSSVQNRKHVVGIILILCASAVRALILSLFELTFEKVIKATTLVWVLRMQIFTNMVASAVSVMVLFASGEWRTIHGEMAMFKNGKVSYVLTLIGIAVGWQAMELGAMRLIARVSSLFANVTSTLALPLVPVLAVALFGDRMTGTKVVAMLMAVWGFLSYVYQHYLDGRQAASARKGRVHAVAG